MRFSLEHRFDAPLDVVVSASFEPAFEERLNDLPNVEERKVTEFDRRGDGTVHRVVHYRFGGHLPGPVRKVIGGSVVSWDEIGEYDPERHEWTFVIRPHVLAGKFACKGRYRFRPDGTGTIREVEVDLKVSIPLVGGRVESVIRDGLTESMEAEADLLDAYVSERRGESG